jgi:hypothetical protein
MDTTQTLISSAISIGAYIIYKVIQRYYIKSRCNENNISIEIIRKDDDEKKEIELTDIKPTQQEDKDARCT